MTQAPIADIIAKRRDRSISSILGFKEVEVDQYLPPEVRANLRKVVVKTLHEYHDLVMDVMSSLDNGQSVINEVYMQRLDEIYTLVSNGSGQNHGS